uniref:serine/threonine-protein kinase PCRK2-like isoform X2 n=1 Tax=Erigeron canadensis TaxID=72917 RepID=UPI001CB92628|nr:serine/threonine-protein kinase PCRK2-like isoform X2 [Erigeron canadensis]
MVFHCRCFSFPLEEEIDIDIEDPKTQTNSTLTEPFYTAPSEFNKAMVEDLVDNVQSNLRVFTYAELEAATNNFCEDSKIGEDGFGSVYKGVIKNPENPLDEENQVTIKYGALKVNVLAVVEHPNIVKLIGYCREGCERGIYELLVYEYMPNKSVNHHLSTKSGAPLSWARRLKVAQDVARALTYLHEEMEFQYIFEDFTSSNIFLDEHWNAKLSDFRVAPLGPSGELTHVSTMVGLHWIGPCLSSSL